ncbi:MAG: hypothetical protein IH995_05675, partial [Proteobacteria bacterium]|nr:hypothetical protein [Pseudomonadota bacterium]
ENGRIVMPPGSPATYQTLTILDKRGGRLTVRETIPVRFVPMTGEALESFRNSENWEIGADASVALITLDAGGSIDTESLKSPVIAFIFGAKGLMYNLTLEGTKVSRIYPK